jgi:hypothetical protein
MSSVKINTIKWDKLREKHLCKAIESISLTAKKNIPTKKLTTNRDKKKTRSFKVKSNIKRKVKWLSRPSLNNTRSSINNNNNIKKPLLTSDSIWTEQVARRCSIIMSLISNTLCSSSNIHLEHLSHADHATHSTPTRNCNISHTTEIL